MSGLPDDAIATLLDLAGPDATDGPDIIEFRQLGGALHRPNDGAALSSLDGEFLVLGFGLHPDPAAWDEGREQATRLLDALAPWQTGREYLPMLDERSDTRKAFPPGVHTRLSALRADVDPERLFVGPHL
jgi:hypothetical protein